MDVWILRLSLVLAIVSSLAGGFFLGSWWASSMVRHLYVGTPLALIGISMMVFFYYDLMGPN